MVRMADRLAENFIPDHSRNNSEQIYKRANSRSRVNSRASLGSSKKLTIIETDSGVLEVHSDKTGILDVMKDANMDAVHHLNNRNPLTRAFWCAIIVIFVVLALIQIYSQIRLYYSNPVATNIEAEYPSKIPFPTVAICNNNQFRLTYVTGGRIMNRNARPISGSLKSIGLDSSSVFDTVMRRSWDMDAVKFLRSAAHWKSRMILGCTWPNGTSCKLSDFKAVWTTTGLCWAINTNPHNPFEVTGSGAGHGLRLLLNVESYERVDACTKHFKTKSLPGLKILIYNQTDVPESSQNGVNVPSGYAMDIPFKMQHRHKLSGVHCIKETEEHKQAEDDFNSFDNIRTCALRKYMMEIESSCHCTMRRAFTATMEVEYPACTVDDYFGCVQPAIQRVREEGTSSNCLPPCEAIDYTAWQDMNRLPQNLMPTLIEEHVQEDENDVEQDDIEEDVYLSRNNREEETFSCEDSAFLDDKQVSMIKRGAHRAYEKQSRHQEDIFLRSRRLITRLRNAIESLSKSKWGWHENDFIGVYERLSKNITCYATFSERHNELVTIFNSGSFLSEEKKTSHIYYLLDEDGYKQNATKYKTIGDLKSRYGDRVEDVVEEIQLILRMIEKLWQIFSENTFQKSLTGDFSRMDRIVELMDQYELNKLQRRAWAEKMMSRQMRHFFDDDFYDSYYQPMMKDLDQSLVKVIDEVNSDWEQFQKYIRAGTASKTGAILLFGEASREKRRKFAELVKDMHKCVSEHVGKEATKLLTSFKRSYRELQGAYTKLFNEELPDYLENFQFGHKFVSDNFAMVNIFLHKMHLERWSQDRTYGFWSLACDVGGALGLFLGISLLTIIELIYLCIQYGFCGSRARNLQLNSLRFGNKTTTCCVNCHKKDQKKDDHRKKSQSYQRRFTIDDDDRYERGTPSEEISKKSIWGQPKASENSSLTPSEVNEFLEQLNRHTQQPSYPDSGTVPINIEGPQLEEQSFDFNEPSNQKLADIAEEDSRRSSQLDDRANRRLVAPAAPPGRQFAGGAPVSSSRNNSNGSGPTSGSFLKPRPTDDEPAADDAEPISVSEVSESTTPALFQGCPPKQSDL